MAQPETSRSDPLALIILQPLRYGQRQDGKAHHSNFQIVLLPPSPSGFRFRSSPETSKISRPFKRPDLGLGLRTGEKRGRLAFPRTSFDARSRYANIGIC